MQGREDEEPQVRLVLAGQDVCPVVLADTYLRRLRGMLWRRRLPPALLLHPGGSVHGMGMTRSLDVAVLVRADAGDRARTTPSTPMRVAKVSLLRPFGFVTGVRGACATLEAPAGSFARWGLAVGDDVAVVGPTG